MKTLYRVRVGNVFVTGVSLTGDLVENVEIDGAIKPGSYLDMGKEVAELVSQHVNGEVEEVQGY